MNTSRVIRDGPESRTPATPSRPATTLPPDLAREGTRRLRWVAALAIGANLLFIAVGLAGPLPSLSPTARALCLAASLLGVPLGIGMFLLASSRRLAPRTILDLALVYEVLDALLIAVGDPRVPLTIEKAGAWSGVAVLVLVFPLIVPNTRGKVVLATIAAAAMDPIGKLLHVAAGASAPSGGALALALAPTAVAAVLAIVMSRVIYRISVEASRAKELGSYRLVEPLGSGGMGEVWRAEHVMLARPAAIKLIRTEGAASGPSREMLHRFEREARATARLSSPHTVQIYDYGTTDEGSFYYVMELLEGFDLDTLVKEFGPVPPERAVHLLRQVCSSLAEAHARGLIHRDIKPANVYVCRYGIEVDFVKVLDFGLVKSAGAFDGADESLTAVGTIAGTPGYMAPEMALGREVGPAADLYSVGCVGYWLLTGRPLFERETPVELLIDHAHTAPPRLSERTSAELPAGLEEILLACLDKEPTRRPESAADLMSALERIRASEPWTVSRARAWWQQHPIRTRVAEEAPTQAIGEATPRVGRAV